MVKVYDHGGLVQHADRLVICTDGQYNSYTDFCTPESTQHSCLKNIRKHLLTERGIASEELQKYKFFNLWIDTGTHEIYVGNEKDDTPELREYLSKHELSVQHAHVSFQNNYSPLDENDNWKTSFDSDFAQYSPKILKRAFRNAHSVDEFKEELKKGDNGDSIKHAQIPEASGPRKYISPYADFMPSVNSFYGGNDIY